MSAASMEKVRQAAEALIAEHPEVQLVGIKGHPDRDSCTLTLRMGPVASWAVIFDSFVDRGELPALMQLKLEQLREDLAHHAAGTL